MQPGMPDLAQLMAQAQQMQDDMAAAQQSLALARVTGSAGGGLVTATVNGEGKLQSLDLDPSVVDPQDTETLADLIVAAVRDAEREAAEQAQAAMDEVTSQMTGLASGLGLGGGFPGMPGLPGSVVDPDENR
jgi:nucleoid-associated protein EbfC